LYGPARRVTESKAPQSPRGDYDGDEAPDAARAPGAVIQSTSIPARGLRPWCVPWPWLSFMPRANPKHLNPRERITTLNWQTVSGQQGFQNPKHLNPREGITTTYRRCGARVACGYADPKHLNPREGITTARTWPSLSAARRSCIQSTSIPARGLRQHARDNPGRFTADESKAPQSPRGDYDAGRKPGPHSRRAGHPKHLNPREGITTSLLRSTVGRCASARSKAPQSPRGDYDTATYVPHGDSP
jgi:hypothetical protein